MGPFTEFHFLRPEWFYALLPLALILWLLWRQRLVSHSWQNVVEPRLLPHLLVGQGAGKKSWILLAVGMGGLLSIVAMAGPAWQKLEVPVFRQPSALVVLLDLSRSMDAADIKPSRLQRAQMKLRDILNQQKEGETALIVFSASPFVVSPLTPDAKTIASQVGSLSTDLMPAQGSRPDRAIGMALQLLQQSGISHGGVLLIGDGLDENSSAELNSAVAELVDAGHSLSVLGVGSTEGAPIPLAGGGFLKDSKGAIVLPGLDDAAMEALARLGHGSYRRIGTDDSDFQAVLASFKNRLAQQQSKQAEGMNSDQWRDEGPWLLLPLLLLAALAFRRGYMLAVVLLLLPLPRPAHALDWNSLWQRDDQRGQQAMQADNPKQAAELFKNPEWRAAANYRAGNYRAAAENLQGIDSSDASYNRGNALAQQGQLQEALRAYEEALKRDPKNADAKFNRDLVEEILKQQQQDQKQGSEGKEQQNKSDENKGQNQSAQPEPAESGSSEGAEQKPGQQDDSAHQQTDAENSGQRDKGDKGGEQGTREPDKQADSNENQPGGNRPLPDARENSGDMNDRPDAVADRQADATEMRQADQQWLRRIPDDPGGLWRRKFLYQYRQQKQPGKSEDKTW